jgi:hypothetical protein
MSLCVICYQYTGLNSSKRIDTIDNGSPDVNGNYNNLTFTYTTFPGNVCSYCDSDIRASNSRIVSNNIASKDWTN